MAQSNPITRLGGWAGYEVVEDWREQRAGQSWCVLRLRPVTGWLRQCSQCGRCTRAVHDQHDRRVRDLPIFEHRVELIVPRLRVACPVCGPKLEHLSWLAPYARVTQRMGQSVAQLCKVASVRHVSSYFALDWKTVKELDFAHLQRELGPVDLDGLQVIGMDEFAIQKGHRYATVIVEPTRKRVLWVGRGRGRADVRPFFELLGPQRCRQLRAAVMDMNAGYEIEVKHHCPQAAVVFDLFHVVAKYAREVIDRVRVDRANELRADKPARRVVKGARWLLLKNAESLQPGQAVQLKELLAANRALFVVHVLRDALKALWSHRQAADAQRAWATWYAQARRSRIEPLKRFAANLKPYLPGILAHCQFPLGTNLIEGINNKIKGIKRMAYGFRDDAYFFLKIRAAFPGIR